MSRHLAEDHPDRLVSQHALAMAYQANGQVTDAVRLLEGLVRIEQTWRRTIPIDWRRSTVWLLCYGNSASVLQR